MNQMLIRVSSVLYNKGEVTVNGQREKFASNGRGSYELTVSADEPVEIQIERRHELLSPAWLFWGLLFFIISCFGIFDVPYGKKGAISFKVNVVPNGHCSVQFNPAAIKDGKAVNVVNDNCVVEELENSLGDAVVKKRRKILSVIKLLLWLALIAVVIVTVITK